MRRQRWRSEQFLDAGFNVVLIAVALVIVGGVWLFMSQTGLAAVSNDAVDLFGAGFATRRAPRRAVGAALRRRDGAARDGARASGGGPSGTPSL